MRWQIAIVVVLLIMGTIDYLDRSTLSIGNPLIRKDLHLSIAQMGWLLSAFSASYAGFSILAGPATDRWGPRRLLAGGALLWSVVQLVTGAVTGFVQFVVLRLLLGLGETPYFPAGIRATSEWVSKKNRSLAVGAFCSCSGLGLALSGPLLTAIMLAFGWRGMFMTMGAAGLVMGIVWWFMYRRPGERLPGVEIDRPEPADAEGAAKDVITARSWVGLFTRPQTWGIMLGFFGNGFLSWIYVTWLPGYFEIARHVTIASTGWLIAIPFTANFVGILFSGVVARGITALGLSEMAGSKYCLIIGLLGMAIFTIPAVFASGLGAAVALITVAEFFGGFPAGMNNNLCAGVAPRRHMSTLSGLSNVGGYFGSTLSPGLTGMIVAATGSFDIPFVIGGIVALAAAVLYLVTVRRPIDESTLEVVRPS